MRGIYEMLDSRERCFFSDGEICGALAEDCDGFRKLCTFRKTAREYHRGRDKSIDRCRELNLCNGCKYTNIKCRKSTEMRTKNGIGGSIFK